MSARLPGFQAARTDPFPLDRPGLRLSNGGMNIVLTVLAYLLGSVPSGVVVARLLGGPDPRSEGSGNIGATNVLRTLGPKAALWTLAGDLLKGVLPVVAARLLLPQGSGWIYLVAGAAIVGHDFSFLLGFRGGKGVATTIGTLFVLNPVIAAMCVATWITVVSVTRYSSAGAITSAILAPVYSVVLGVTGHMTIFCLGAGILLILLHRENIARLAKGEEKRVSFGKERS